MSPCKHFACAVLAILAFAASFNANQLVHADLIQNGDFEIFSPFHANPGSPISNGGWTFENHAGVVATVGNPDNASRLESNGNSTWDPTISQTVSGLSIGTTYEVSWDLALRFSTSGSGSGRSFGVFLDNQSFGDALLFDEYLSTAYKTDSVTFVATATSHTLIFASELDNRTNGGVGNTDVSYNIDNISMIAAVPEPTGLICLGAALVSMSVFYRRR